MAHGVFLVLGYVSVALLACAVYAAVLCVRRSWKDARRTAAWVALGSVVVEVIAVIVVIFATRRGLGTNAALPGETSSKARMLAENIAEGMNYTAPVALAVVFAIVVWIVAFVAGARGAGPREL